VAGIISADDNSIGVVGVAPNCNIYAVQVGNRRLLVTDIVEGIDWVIATHNDGDPNNDIQVINMSFGGGQSTSEKIALQAAYDAGILLIAAAGNNGGAVSHPAAYSFVMAISASTSGDVMAGYSNFGSEIEIIAPGSSIYSTSKGGGYATMSGTSMASPMAVGVAALAWSAHPSYSSSQIRNLLKNSAEDIGLSASRQGSGLADAEKAAMGTTNGNNLGGGGNNGGGADTMHVVSITYANNKRNLSIYVTVHDEAHTNPVSGASVSFSLQHIGGNVYNFGGSTGSNGTIKFTLRGISSGLCFDGTVTNVTKSGWTYNAASNEETSDSYCIP
jgi:subtilisin family serine protease